MNYKEHVLQGNYLCDVTVMKDFQQTLPHVLKRVIAAVGNYDFYRRNGYRQGLPSSLQMSLDNTFYHGGQIAPFTKEEAQKIAILATQTNAKRIKGEQIKVEASILKLHEDGFDKCVSEIFGSTENVKKEVVIVPIGTYAGMLGSDEPITMRVDRQEEYPLLTAGEHPVYSRELTDEWVLVHEIGAHAASVKQRQGTKITEDDYTNHPLKESLMDVVTAWILMRMYPNRYKYFGDTSFFLQGQGFRDKIIDIFCEKNDSYKLKHPEDFKTVVDQVLTI